MGEDLDLGRAQLGDLRLAEEEEEESSGRGRSSDTIELRPGRGTAQRGDVMEAASDDSDPVRFLGGAVGTRREDKMFAKMGGMRSSSPRSESAGRGGWGFDQDDGVVELGLHRDGLMQGASQARSSEEAEESSELWPTRPVPSPQRPMKGLIEVMSQEDYQVWCCPGPQCLEGYPFLPPHLSSSPSPSSSSCPSPSPSPSPVGRHGLMC